MSLTFQNIIFRLQHFWASKGCVILQPYDLEVGAGTFHPATVIRSLGSDDWNAAFVQTSRRPTDSRFANHPNRTQHYYQFQVILKPSPDDMQQLYLESLQNIDISITQNDIRFVEDDWKSPTLGASGLGWEVWYNGMEVSQFTYMQQIGNIPLSPIAGEITYGLERLAMLIQRVNKIADIKWNQNMTYAEVDFEAEKQFSQYNLHEADTKLLFRQFNDIEKEANRLIESNLPLVAYEFCMKASHVFNLLDARGVISVVERESYITRVRNLTKSSCLKWMEEKHQHA